MIRYEPADGFIGRDTFEYTAQSGSDLGYFTNTEKVLVEVRDDLCPLALHYSFEEKSGNVIEDKAWGISSHNATLKNIANVSNNKVPGVVGEAISLPNNTDGVTLNDVLDPIDKDLSISIWFKLYQLPPIDGESSKAIIFDSGARAGLSQVGLGIRAEKDGIAFVAQPETRPGGGAILNYIAPLVADQWYHAVLIVDRTSNTLKAYVNGVEVTYSSKPNINFEPTKIIKGYPGYVNPNTGIITRPATTLGHETARPNGENVMVLRGAIDELKIYTKALTPAEVLILYTTPDKTESVDKCSTSLSVEDDFTKLNNQIIVYPNPASSQIKISGLTPDIKTYKIINTVGQEIQEGTITNTSEIDIKLLSKGIYFLRFDNGKTVKFIKE